MKKTLLALVILAAIVTFSACETIVPEPDNAIPNRMVSQIAITAEPEDSSMIRSYADQEQLSPIMRMLRDMDTGEAPKTNPQQRGEQISYTITVTYSNGTTNAYTILDNRYLRVGDGAWCESEPEKIEELIAFIRDNPNE